ncbi:MAG: VOC family protein [Actinobacteria bacterium]|nr:VOC family protein [Actinomycetota bacterium]MBI3687711.1 VOC family protein [Actinomycetota bacterium]
MPIGELAATTLDARDPKELAEFYSKVTGWDVIFSSDDVTYIGPGGTPRLAFQRVADHTAPSWPSSAKQFHLDFSVQDMDDAEKQLLELGATKPEYQPGGEKWRVLNDPAGHQFCIAVFS